MAILSNFYSTCKLAVCGALIGIANLIPGVSGATVAVVFHQYERLITSCNAVLTGGVSISNIRYLVTIGVGAVGAILLLSEVLEWVLVAYNGVFRVVISGFILGTLPFVRVNQSQRVSWRYPVRSPLFYVGIVVIILLGVLTPPVGAVGDVSPMMMGVSGALAIVAMVVPGVSGSMILMIIGTYASILSGIGDRNIVLLWPFIVGVLLGGMGSIKGLHWVIHRYPLPFQSLVMGLLVGSIGFILMSDTVFDLPIWVSISGWVMATMTSFKWGAYAKR
ncbi:MAG: DUF368 domain-containing protein [Candidatus Marinamargulisbacteria bacterium]